MSSYDREPSGWAIGWTWFAGLMMVMAGFWHAIAGLTAIIDDEFFVPTQNYILKFDVSTWGWIHLLVGIVIVLAGFALFRGAVWARTLGVIMALVSGLAAFAWLPYYPIWGIIIIIAAVAVIWSLTVHGRDVTTQM
jgi:hypothetical protein